VGIEPSTDSGCVHPRLFIGLPLEISHVTMIYMHNTWFYRTLFTIGITLICVSPFLLYFAPVWFGRSICRPEDYAQQGSVLPCGDVYIPFAIGVSVMTLIVGCLITVIANRLKSESLKK
jgi:hypothetical protein